MRLPATSRIPPSLRTNRVFLTHVDTKQTDAAPRIPGILAVYKYKSTEVSNTRDGKADK